MDTYGLLGYPLGHSFSRKFFTEKFSNEGIDAEYLNFEIPDASQLRDIVSRHPQLRGLNVTIPHKQAVISQLDALSPQAREIGAVNVIKVDRNTDGTPRLTGYNADVIGFSQSIRPLLQPYHRKALILGTGGASKAVCYGLKQLDVEPVWVSRHAPLSDIRRNYPRTAAGIYRHCQLYSIGHVSTHGRMPSTALRITDFTTSFVRFDLQSRRNHVYETRPTGRSRHEERT